MLLRRTAALLVAALTLASCDNPAGPDPDPSGSAVPAKLDVVAGGDQRDTVGQELPQPLVVRVLDARGRPVRDAIVNFRVISGGGSVFAGAALTNADGEARERWTLGTVARDTQRVEARAVDPATGQAVVFGAFTAVGVADAPANIAPMGPAALAASPGAVVPVAVRVEDRFGNRVAGAVIAWQLPEGQGTVTPTQAGTDSTGVAAAQWTLAYAVGAHTLTAFAGTSLSTQFTAAAETPNGSRLAAVSGDQQVAAAGSALAQPLVVQLRNAAGQPIRNAAVAWSVTAGTITPGSAVTDAEGRVSATWNPGTTAGARTATASAAGAGSAVFTAQVRAGAAA
ncbi:MAG TPA: Ig-like domain-containing protein, partial [Longimicrobium sp.]